MANMEQGGHGGHAAGVSERGCAALGGDIESLLACIHAKDGYTGDHCRRVGILAHGLALALLPHDPFFCGSMLVAGRLHDIGKIALPDAVLLKTGRLDAEEWAAMREHPAAGERILRPRFASSPEILGAIRGHHERHDGGGYPDGLAGDQIPVGAAILAVCDAYDAMTSARPYREAPRSRAEALGEIEAGAGAQWAPRVVAAFLLLAGFPPLGGL